mgnify:FL=1|tara:strand:+ start:3344 stop:4192 length:849 start_codon:yes stop_codon:yes gene_type:complete
MTKQTRRAPERPKAQVEDATIESPVLEVTASKPKKKNIIKRKEDSTTHVEFEIPSRAGVVYMLPQKGVTIFDSENDTVREIRYCPNEPSIYVDEQSDNAIKESVAFREGKLFVPKEKPNLRKFMESHPMNTANGGHIFRKVDKKKDASNELEKEFKVSEAVAMVRDKDINDLLPIALYFNVNINKPSSEIRFNLLRIAKSKPQDFIESFDSPSVTARSIVQQAKDYQIIEVKEDRCSWFDSKSMIVSVPVGQDPMDVMIRFCLTEKGSAVLSSLEERLEKLA